MPTVLSIPFEAAGPKVARRFVERFATDLQLDGMADTLSVIVSELVTNAIVHGAKPVQLTLLYQDGEVRIEVADGDPHVASIAPYTADNAEPGGRGLRIVAALADQWGARPSRSGKTVWAITHTTHA